MQSSTSLSGRHSLPQQKLNSGFSLYAAAWPLVGTLAHLEPALILTPLRGVEAGYVSIATRQEAETSR
jgi:hypothetical protein